VILGSVRAWSSVLLLLLLSGCGKGAKDRVVASAEAPVKLTVRSHEVRVKADCEETGLARLKCLVLPSHDEGCTYLDVGPLPDEAPGSNPCDVTAETREVLERARIDRFELVVDPAGERVAWRSGPARPWRFLHLLDGHLIDAAGEAPATVVEDRRDAGDTRERVALIFSGVETADQVLDVLFARARADAREAVVARVRARGGDDGVAALLEKVSPVVDGWDTLYDALDEARQQRVRASVVARMRDGDSDALAWLDDRPEAQPPDFHELLAERARADLALGDFGAVEGWLRRAVERADVRAGPLACELLEARELSETWMADESMGDYPGGDAAEPGAWFAIAQQRTRCGAVSRLLRDPCARELRCEPLRDAGVGADAEGAEEDTSPEEQAHWPLCTAADAEAARTSWLGEEDPGDPAGAAEMGALRAQGPLPKELLLKNARRDYRVDRAPLSEDDLDRTSPCTAADTDLAEFFCRLRPEQTDLVVSQCRVQVDDARQVVTLTSLAPVEDAGVEGGR